MARDGDSDCGTMQPKQYTRLTCHAFGWGYIEQRDAAVVHFNSDG